MARKSCKHEVDQRVDIVARMLVNAATTSQICRFAKVEWGVSESTALRYLKRARQAIRDDYSQERSEFLASRLGVLDSVIQKAIKSNQLSAACGACRLQAELAQLLNK